MVDDTKENSVKCLCKSCPSKNQCMDGDEGFLYCAKGRTKCEMTKKGCICGACQIFAKYKLADYYFCQGGKAQ